MASCMIGALLGHSTVETTKRDAHMFNDPLKKAVRPVAAAIIAAAKPIEAPIDIKHKRR